MSRTATMTGGQAIVGALSEHGIDTVFGLPGVQIYGLFDALQRSGMRTIGARHEQGCGYMAFGYARSTGRPSAYAVVPGPGLLNSAAAALTSYSCNEPVLCLTGQVPTDFLDRGHGHLHEMRDQLGLLKNLFKAAYRIEAPALAPELVARAFQDMLSGRPGPAALEMPWDVFLRSGPVAPFGRLPAVPNPPVDTDRIDEAARLIAAARAPMIYVGGGAFGAADDILELAELIDAPVTAFRSGRGIVSNAHELGLNMAAAYNLWPATDLVIGIGTRLELPRWHWPQKPPGQKTIRIDIDPVALRRWPSEVDVLADAGEAVRALVAALRAQRRAGSGRRAAIREASAKAHRDMRAIQPQIAYLDILRDVLPDDGFVTDEVSQAGFASWFGFPVYRPRTYISSGYQGNLGSGFQTALGAKVAHPDKPVVAICGDGGFTFGLPELATAVQYGIGVVALVFNNHSFGNVRRDQLRDFGGRAIASDLVNPDFVRLADAFGAGASRVSSPDALRPALERALADGRPWIVDIEVPKDSEASPWPFIIPSPPPPGAI